MPLEPEAAAGDVEHAVVNVLRYFESPGTIVFCNTREAVRHLQAALLERGFSVVALSGELTQNERTHALQSLRDGRARERKIAESELRRRLAEANAASKC